MPTTQEQHFIQQLQAHQAIVHKVCNMYVHDITEREDLFQEISGQAWKAFASFRGDAKFSTWLYRVAINTAVAHYRKQKRTITTITADSFPTIAQSDDTLEKQQAIAMYKAIAALPPVDKALVMLYLDDFSYADIGETLGITANNVAVKMNRLKQKLKVDSEKILETL
jgi:RNA polymerase sigma-70 factor (ECF subfamily)